MTRVHTLVLLAVAVIGCRAQAQHRPAPDQRAALLVRHPQIARALEVLRSDNGWTVEQQISICEIPAPPFKERARAEELARRFAALGLTRARIDAEGNVIAERPGTRSAPFVVVSGHLDTVFPEGTDVRVRRDGARLRGPGIADDCRGLAALLAVARALQRVPIRTDATILFVGTVGEEGAGNLRGVRHLLTRELAGRVGYFISVDGATVDEITSRAVGSHRYRVRFTGPGGHSYSDFGMPNPTHALGRAIATIADMRVADAPKTTFNVGIVRGGTSVNAISAEATMDVDLRSESQEALNEADRRFRRAVDDALAAELARWPSPSEATLAVALDTIGLRPAGAVPDSATIVRTAVAASRALGISSHTVAQSTDANLPISLGIPAITIGGGGREGGAHSLDEWYEDGPNGHVGPQRVLLVIVALAGMR